MTEVVICGLDELEAVMTKTQAECAITLLGPGMETPAVIAAVDHLRFSFDDTVDIRHPEAPTLEAIRRLVSEGSELLKRAAESKKPLVIHCHGGICRSTAAALILLSEWNDPLDAMRTVLRIRQEADPNMLMCQLADQVFGGSLLEEAVQWAQPEISRRFIERHELE